MDVVPTFVVVEIRRVKKRIVAPSGCRKIEEALHAVGRPVELHVIEAPYGHDCFLLEEARQTPIIRQFLSQHGLAEGGPAADDEASG